MGGSIILYVTACFFLSLLGRCIYQGGLSRLAIFRVPFHLPAPGPWPPLTSIHRRLPTFMQEVVTYFFVTACSLGGALSWGPIDIVGRTPQER
ncbi:hypothetical protein F4775DRAFT_553790 [Biscogniauxia sp. FL1348]|nr:hypothetical protein F4775DRAFT_553790 [Biscogniauxia sp. FL1348]